MSRVRILALNKTEAGTMIDEERKLLTLGVEIIEDKIRTHPKGSSERLRLGQVKNRLDSKLRDLNRKDPKGRELSHYMVDLIKKDMTKIQFDSLLNKARKLKELDA